jgi:hypothetical protein
MAISRIRLTFTDDNSGANENDGYKVYRNIGSDPCPGGVIDASKLYHTHNTPTTGSDVQYTDMSAGPGTPYFYRASFTRGSDEVLSPNVIGPVAFPSADALGYPYNVPSNQSGVAHFIDTEPLLHIDAEKNLIEWGYNDITSTVVNSASSYNLGVKGPGAAANHQLSVLEFDAGGTQSAIPVVGYDPTFTHYWARNHQSTDNLADLGNHLGFTGNKHIVMDDGTTEVSVMTSATGPINPYGTPTGTSFVQNHSHHKLFKGMISYAHTDMVWSWKNKAQWVNPDPQPWMVPYANPYYMGANKHQNASFSIGLDKIYGYAFNNPDNDAALPVLGTQSHWHERLHVIVSRIMPDGSQKVFVNGDLILETTGARKTSATGYYWDDNTNAAVNLGQTVDYNFYPTIIAGGAGEVLYGSANRAESIFVPKAISNEEILRLIAYAQDKFDGYLSTQSSYIGL